jgi:NAD-dependent dihydropyrimidine dehydrogenase PreA subunit
VKGGLPSDAVAFGLPLNDLVAAERSEAALGEKLLMKPQITVVVSQGQSSHPAKRAMENEIAERLSGQQQLDVLVVPNLYDLRPDGAALAALRELSGHLIVLSWLYPRAAHWILDRHGISGALGASLLRLPTDEEETDEADGDRVERVVDSRPRPSRSIYCADLRACESAEPVFGEVARIVAELGGEPALAGHTQGGEETGLAPGGNAARRWRQIDDEADRRWYPVIDFSRCTNCMECIDFCLFGVYGIDRAETILVEQPDNCRKGCPACSRVCPENAIIFPQHKTPAIAGAPAAAGGFKIDLSRLFGGPSPGEDAHAVAARERDEQLLAAGRQAVGTAVAAAQPKKPSDRIPDELDALVDALDAFV